MKNYLSVTSTTTITTTSTVTATATSISTAISSPSSTISTSVVTTPASIISSSVIVCLTIIIYTCEISWLKISYLCKSLIDFKVLIVNIDNLGNMNIDVIVILDQIKIWLLLNVIMDLCRVLNNN